MTTRPVSCAENARPARICTPSVEKKPAVIAPRSDSTAFDSVASAETLTRGPIVA